MKYIVIIIYNNNFSDKSGYANNLKCRWSIVRPKFTGISLKVISLDLEEHINCNYDYIAYSIGDIDFKDGQIRYLCEEYFQHLYFASNKFFFPFLISFIA